MQYSTSRTSDVADRVGQQYDETSAKIQSTSASISREFHSLLADVEDFIVASTSLTGEQLEEAKQQLKERVAEAREVVDDLGETVIVKAKRTAALTNEYVHDQPWAAVGMGLVVGFVSGVALARRN